jgi:hypothetical protein
MCRVLLVLISPLMLFSQVSFGEPMIIREATNCSPVQSDLADFDQDGDLDVVVSSLRDPALFWLENTNGQGLFEGYTLISSHQNGYYWPIEVADIDADGSPDVVALVEGHGSLVWFQNDGSGGEVWTERVIMDPCDDWCGGQFTTADVDNDGDIDIIRYNRQVGLGWLPNLGWGQFGEPNEIAIATSNVDHMIAVDMDADNDIDILIWDEFGIRWIMNSANIGSYTTITSVNEDNPGSYWVRFLDAADLNGDGLKDILLITDANTPDGGFETKWMPNQDFGQTFDTTLTIADWGTAIFSLDYDNDGDQDVAIADRGLRLYENIDGLGSFQAHGDSAVAWIGGLDIQNLNTGDIDGDGDLDFLHSGESGGGMFPPPHTFHWYENTGSWDLTARTVDFSTYNVIAEDLNGDGSSEAIMITENAISWCSISDAGVGEIHEINIPSPWGMYPLPQFASFKDLDGDGDADLLAYTLTAGMMFYDGYSSPSWAFNEDGDGNFGTFHTFPDVIGPIETADMDGDGDLDILGAQIEPASFVWVENTGLADLFTSIHPISSIDFVPNENPFRIKAGDMDGDGDLDVVATTTDLDHNTELVWYENPDGAGDFQGSAIPISIVSDVNIWYTPFVLADINGDDAIDLLVEFEGDDNGSVALLVNTPGTGGFEQVLTINGWRDMFDFIDLDGDSDLDIIMSEYFSDSQSEGLIWLENQDGLGTYSDTMTISHDVSMGYGTDAAVSDFDGDGIKDILGIYSAHDSYPAAGSCVLLSGENLTGLHGNGRIVPTSLTLFQNYPNPFNPTTTIRYELPEQSKVRLSIFDVRGQEVRTLRETEQATGHYEVQWNGLNQSGNPVSTGVYFARLGAGEFSQTIKMLYLK